jgi:hypothetical protein
LAVVVEDHFAFVIQLAAINGLDLRPSRFWPLNHSQSTINRDSAPATSSKIIFRSNAREIRWVLITEECSAWKLRGGLMKNSTVAGILGHQEQS